MKNLLTFMMTINYILHHEITEKARDFTDCAYVNLSRSTNIFFDYIKILERSREMHLLDSVWAVFVYLLDHGNII